MTKPQNRAIDFGLFTRCQKSILNISFARVFTATYLSKVVPFFRELINEHLRVVKNAVFLVDTCFLVNFVGVVQLSRRETTE